MLSLLGIFPKILGIWESTWDRFRLRDEHNVQGGLRNRTVLVCVSAHFIININYYCSVFSTDKWYSVRFSSVTFKTVVNSIPPQRSLRLLPIKPNRIFVNHRSCNFFLQYLRTALRIEMFPASQKITSFHSAVSTYQKYTRQIRLRAFVKLELKLPSA